MSVNNLLAQEHASYRNRHNLNFRVIYTYLGIFNVFRSKGLEKELISSVQIISGLDRQSKFQMFAVFSGRHVVVPWRYTNMAAPCRALSF